MSFSQFRLPRSVLGIAAVLPTLSLAQSVPTAHPAPDADTVRLAKLEVTGEKEREFSLPLDATPATGSRLGLSNRDLPASISIVSQELIQLRGLRTAVEAVEAAVGMTGGTQFGSIPGYASRGFSGNSVTILRDGIRQNTASQSSRQIDSFLLDRVEVLKGPASLLFGEGAIGGAVNYVSKSPSSAAGGEVVASAGYWDTYRFGIGWGGPVSLGKGVKPLLTRFDYIHSETAGYVDRNNQRYDGYSAALGWEVLPKLKLTYQSTFLTDYNKSYYGNPVIYDAVINTTVANASPEVRSFVSATDRMVNPRVDSSARRTNYNILDDYAETENSFNRLRAEYALSPEWEVRNESYVATQLLKWRNLETNTWNPVTQLVARSSFLHIYRDDVLTGNRVEVAHQGSLAGFGHRFVVGHLFERNNQIRGTTPFGLASTATAVSLTNPTLTTGPGVWNQFLKTARIDVQTNAFFLEDSLDLTPSLKLISGLRRDSIQLRRDTLVTPTTSAATYRKSYAPTTGRAGVVWAMTPRVNIYASYSRAAEPTTQLVSFTAASNDFALQTGRQYEVGAKGSFLQDKLNFTAALFDIEKNNILASTLDPVSGLRISQQIGSQRSRGGEFSAAFAPGAGWRLEANAAYTDAWFGRFAENLGAGVIDRAGRTPSNIPTWVTSLFAIKSFQNGFSVQGTVRHVSDRFGNNNNSVVAAGYTTFDASLGYSRGNWSVTLRGRNLTDEEYEPVAGTTMRRLADPRSVEVSTRLSF